MSFSAGSSGFHPGTLNTAPGSSSQVKQVKEANMAYPMVKQVRLPCMLSQAARHLNLYLPLM
jgi:hypothetical protein